MTQTIPLLSTTQIESTTRIHRRQTIATLLGEPSYELIDWRRLLADGVLIQLHIRRCRFSTRLTLEDIGVKVDDDSVREKLSKWLVLGEKRLLPVVYMKALGRIESSARYALKERSFRTELGAFVPSSAYIGWRESTEELKKRYLALRDDIIANHRALTRQVLTEYEVIAADTYQRLRSTHPAVLTESQEQFVITYSNRITSQIPSPQRIRDTFDFTYLLIDSLSQLGPQQEGQQNTQVQIDQARTQVQQREWQRQVLDQDLRLHATERVHAALDSFLSQIVGQLRSLTYTVACDVLGTLQRRGEGGIAHQSVRQLSNLLTQVRELNFYGDSEMERMMQQVQAIVEQSTEERQHHSDDIARTLRAIATVTRTTLLDLEKEPKSARAIAISDQPTEASVRQARAELGLDLDAAQFTHLSSMRSEVRVERAEASSMQTLWSAMQVDQRTARVL